MPQRMKKARPRRKEKPELNEMICQKNQLKNLHEASIFAHKTK